MSCTGSFFSDLKCVLGSEYWRDYDLNAIYYDSPCSDVDDLSDEDFWQLVETHKLDSDQVYDDYDNIISFSAACHYMDKDICEELHNGSKTYDFSQGRDRYDFLEEYAWAHFNKYHEDFAPFVGGAW